MDKYSRVKLYLERAESFSDRAISLLKRMNLENGYTKEITDFQDRLFSTGIDSEEIYNQVSDFSSSLSDEYTLLINGMYSSVLISLYHLWEHDIRDLCKHKSWWSSVSKEGNPVTEQEIQRYQYETLKSLLQFWGAQESTFDQVNLLRLVANTAKHGPGPSATELLSVSREYYCKLALFRDLDILEVGVQYDEIANLSINDIEYFRSVLKSFWMELGDQVSA
jgi:hypothetical protein